MTMTDQNQHEIVSKVINFQNFTPKYGQVISLRSSLAVKNDRLVLLVLNQCMWHLFCRDICKISCWQSYWLGMSIEPISMSLSSYKANPQMRGRRSKESADSCHWDQVPRVDWNGRSSLAQCFWVFVVLTASTAWLCCRWRLQTSTFERHRDLRRHWETRARLDAQIRVQK